MTHQQHSDGSPEQTVGTPSDLIEKPDYVSGLVFDLSGWRKIDVSGPDTLRFFESLGVVEVLAPGRSARFRLWPDGAVHSLATVLLAGPTALVVEDGRADPSCLVALKAHQGALEVTLRDRSHELALFALPHALHEPSVAGSSVTRPSCLGEGLDVVAMGEDHDRVLRSLTRSRSLGTAEELEEVGAISRLSFLRRDPDS